MSLCVCIPMFPSCINSQTDYLWSLQRSIRVWILVGLVVAEGAIIQRAPATTELCPEEQVKKIDQNTIILKEQNDKDGIYTHYTFICLLYY